METSFSPVQLKEVSISTVPIKFSHVAHVTHVNGLLVHTIYEASSVCHVAKLDFDWTVHVVRNLSCPGNPR
jgi:hypothetical protein